MKVDLTIQQYSYLRAIHELKGDCEASALACDQCPLALGIDIMRSAYKSKECVKPGIRYKIATSILSLDPDLKEILVVDKLSEE